jgi:hypothetical protein
MQKYVRARLPFVFGSGLTRVYLYQLSSDMIDSIEKYSLTFLQRLNLRKPVLFCWYSKLILYVFDAYIHLLFRL